MTLSTLLRYQAAYAVMGVAYNIISYLVTAFGGAQLSTTPPAKGGVAMAVYGLMLLAGYYRKITTYRILMGLAILVYGYGGIIKHLILFSQDPSLYASVVAWILAVGINVFGLALNAVAMFGRFTIDTDTNNG